MLLCFQNINNISDADYEKGLYNLSLEKKERLLRMRSEKDKKRTLAGDMLSKKCISKFCEIPIDTITISTDGMGNPYVKDHLVNISIAHSDDYAVCATDYSPVGVDIEKVKAINKNSCKYFSPEEKELILNPKLPR